MKAKLKFSTLALFVFLAGSAGAATLTVVNANDSGAGSLRDTIAAAAAGDTINFAPALNGQTILLTSGSLGISKNLTITGPGATNLAVSGDGNSRVFVIGEDVSGVLSGLTITNGYGGIYNNRGNLTVRDSVITGNNTEEGGGIYNVSGTLTVTNCIITGNSASTWGGGLYNFRFGQVQASATVQSSIISGNSGNQGGGGVFNVQGTVVIRSSSVSGNSSLTGGGLYNYVSATMIVSNSMVTGNECRENAAGIYNHQSVLTIQHSTISSNSAPSSGGLLNTANGSVKAQNSTFSGNVALTQGGGGIGSGAGSLVLQHCTITGNSAPEDLAGGILASGSDSLTNCIVANNWDSSGPSDINGVVENAAYNLVGSSNTVVGVVNGVNGNIVGDGSGGTIPVSSILDTNLAFNGGTTPTHVLVSGSVAINAGLNTGAAGLVTDQRGSGFARVIFGSVDIGAFEFQAIGLLGNGLFIPDHDVTPRDADGTDFGFLAVGPVSAARTFSITNGGATILTVTNVSVTGGQAADFNISGISLPTNVPAGGTLRFTVTFTAGAFGSRTTTVLFTHNGAPSPYRFSIQGAGCTGSITVTSPNDSGPGSLRQALLDICPGGTIDFAPALNGRTLIETNGTLFLSRSVTILGPGPTNLMVRGNGLSRVFRVDPGVTCTLAGLTITNGWENGEMGGAGIRHEGIFLTVSNCTVSGNSVSGNFGGGIENLGTVVLQNSTLSGNFAPVGGGLRNLGTAVVQNCTFIRNSSSLAGGAIQNDSVLTMQNCELSGNTSDHGGGIYSAGTATVQNSTFSDNAARLGGGIRIQNPGVLTLRNCTLTGNRATGGFPGGAGLFAHDGTESLTNCIVAGNFAGTTPDDIGGIGVDSAANNLIGATNGVVGITNGIDGNIVGAMGGAPLALTSILNTNLAFNGGPTRTHALVPGSLAIDTGLNSGAAGLADDQRGPDYVRVAGAAVDIGAFEMQAVTGPLLTITRVPGQAILSWLPATPGFVLQETLSLAPSNWVNSVSGATNPVSVPTAGPNKFYRLRKP